jgi:uncharacterized protein
MPDHGLTSDQINIIHDVLAPYADRIKLVGLFGSRAEGTFRPNSDIDMVIYGDLNQADADRIWTLFDASGLSIKVDVIIYDLIAYPPLKEHIDRVMVPLITKA